MQHYVVRPKIDKSGDEEKVRYYGIPVISGQIDEDYLAAEICRRSSLTEGDVLAAISLLKDVIKEGLQVGQSVKLKGLGTFSVSASSKGFDTEEECTPSHVKAQRICFRADRGMRSVLEKIKYIKTERPRKK